MLVVGAGASDDGGVGAAAFTTSLAGARSIDDVLPLRLSLPLDALSLGALLDLERTE